MKARRVFRNFRTFILVFPFLIAVGASPPPDSGTLPMPSLPEGEEGEDLVPQVPMYGDGWIEFAPAPVYESKNDLVTTITKLDKVEAFACAVFKFRPDGNIESWPGPQPKGAYWVVTNVDLPFGITGGTELKCKEYCKMVLETELGGGVVERKGNKRFLKQVHLRLRNYDAEKKTECVVHGQVVRTNSERSEGRRAKWWGNNLHDWPLENGHSEIVGRFQYTLHV